MMGHSYHFQTPTMEDLYAIVVFTEKEADNDVAMIPTEWCIGVDQCYWAPYKGLVRFEKAIRTCEPHAEYWEKFSIRILKTAGTVINNNSCKHYQILGLT